jgi:hypothetical protein
MLTGEKL